MNVETPIQPDPAEDSRMSALRGRFARALANVQGQTAGFSAFGVVLGLAFAASLLATIYWMAIASDRYVSQASVVVQRAQLPGGGPADLGGLLTGGSTTGNRGDQMLLRDHLLSFDMLRKLDAKLHLRAHYSDRNRDFITRASSDALPIERFRDYFLSRVRIDYDDYEGVLELRVEAFDPATAQAIVREMLREGEAFMNDTDHKLASAQVDFLEQALLQTAQRNQKAREAVLAFQSQAGMVSPEDSLRSAAQTIAQLESRQTALQVQLGTLQSYLVSDHPDVIAVRQQIASINRQIEVERTKTTSPANGGLNRSTERFQRLQQDAAFTQSLYQTTLAALEKGRIDAARAVKKVSILQTPTLPEYAEQPRRAYNSLVFALIALLVAGISLLLVSIVRDHFD
jgi:capsular polysaccharide transport system permease protein